jgi:hypothetical protein
MSGVRVKGTALQRRPLHRSYPENTINFNNDDVILIVESTSGTTSFLSRNFDEDASKNSELTVKKVKVETGKKILKNGRHEHTNNIKLVVIGASLEAAELKKGKA